MEQPHARHTGGRIHPNHRPSAKSRRSVRLGRRPEPSPRASHAGWSRQDPHCPRTGRRGVRPESGSTPAANAGKRNCSISTTASATGSYGSNAEAWPRRQSFPRAGAGHRAVEPPLAELDHIERKAARPNALFGFDDDIRMRWDRQGRTRGHAVFYRPRRACLSTAAEHADAFQPGGPKKLVDRRDRASV